MIQVVLGNANEATEPTVVYRGRKQGEPLLSLHRLDPESERRRVVQPIYLVIRDAALRSSLSAWLGLAGHAIVALEELAPLVDRRPDATALFVIDGDLLPADRDTWIDALAPIAPHARCILLVADATDPSGPLVLADRRAALPLIEAMVAQTKEHQPTG